MIDNIIIYNVVIYWFISILHIFVVRCIKIKVLNFNNLHNLDSVVFIIYFVYYFSMMFLSGQLYLYYKSYINSNIFNKIL